MKEEDYLIERVGKQNPFRVPEGYFDGLAEQVMARIDAEGVRPQQKARTVWLRPVFYAVAASVCALFISVAAYQGFSNQSDQASAATVAVNQASDNSFDEAADYLMVDNQDIYACLSGDY